MLEKNQESNYYQTCAFLFLFSLFSIAISYFLLFYFPLYWPLFVFPVPSRDIISARLCPCLPRKMAILIDHSSESRHNYTFQEPVQKQPHSKSKSKDFNILRGRIIQSITICSIIYTLSWFCKFCEFCFNNMKQLFF